MTGPGDELAALLAKLDAIAAESVHWPKHAQDELEKAIREVAADAMCAPCGHPLRDHNAGA